MTEKEIVDYIKKEIKVYEENVKKFCTLAREKLNADDIDSALQYQDAVNRASDYACALRDVLRFIEGDINEKEN